MKIEPGTNLNLHFFGPARVQNIITDPLTFEQVAMVYTRGAHITLSLKYCERVAVKDDK